MAILNAYGADITGDLTDAANQDGLPLLLVLGCAIAESNLRPDAERWGTRTAEAKDAIARQDWAALQRIIDAVVTISPDISFGYLQQVIKWHYLGDHEHTVANCLEVRRQVFADPRGNLFDGARRLAGTLRTARSHDLAPVDGDELLGACVVYNAGHWPANPQEWAARKSRVQHYRESLTKAATLLEEMDMTEPEYVSPEDVTFATRIKELGPKLGSPLTDEMPITECTIQAFENGVLVMIPGAGAYLWPEGTVADRFRPASGR